MRHYLAFALLAVGALTVPADAQVLYGTILGTVRDSTGAVVPNATVAIINQQTNQSRTDTTSSVGLYTFSNVLQGFTSWRSTPPGFNPSRRPSFG